MQFPLSRVNLQRKSYPRKRTSSKSRQKDAPGDGDGDGDIRRQSIGEALLPGARAAEGGGGGEHGLGPGLRGGGRSGRARPKN